mmetsp:Transcript_49194/g.115073  ORF Transcript_49194/g.115073 Transcript_49194/m.115073 type:complete len:201 (-) Transcript_49194:1542-2144(-)
MLVSSSASSSGASCRSSGTSSKSIRDPLLDNWDKALLLGVAGPCGSMATCAKVKPPAADADPCLEDGRLGRSSEREEYTPTLLRSSSVSVVCASTEGTSSNGKVCVERTAAEASLPARRILLDRLEVSDGARWRCKKASEPVSLIVSGPSGGNRGGSSSRSLDERDFDGFAAGAILTWPPWGGLSVRALLSPGGLSGLGL